MTPDRATLEVLGRGERVSRQLITEYRSELDRIHAASGSKLLARVITVSLETVKITDAMRNLDRANNEDKQ